MNNKKKLSTIRTKTPFNLFLSFAFAVVIVIAVLNFIFGLLVHFFDDDQSIWWHTFSPVVCVFIISLVILSSVYKSIKYKKNGCRIAESLNAIKIEKMDSTPEEVAALVLNQEIAETYGLRPAHLYFLPDESGINALTVGYTKRDATIILTWGALQSVDQDELKGILAYEYYNILTGNYSQNTRLEVLLFGLIIISQWGSKLVVRGTRRKNLVTDSMFAAIYVALGSLIWLIGSLGVLVSRLLKFLFLYLSKLRIDEQVISIVDSKYVLHAFMRIYVHDTGSQIYRVESESLAHYCFANALSEQSWFTVHSSLSNRINRLHPNFHHKVIKTDKPSFRTIQNMIAQILLPTNEKILLASLDEQKWQAPKPLPILRISPISFITKDAIRPLSYEIRKSMERPELLKRAMQTSTGSREVLTAILMIRQYREFVPQDAQVSKAIVDALLKVDGRVHIQILYEALSNIVQMPIISSIEYLSKLAHIIQADGEVGLLDCLLLDRVKASQGLLEDAMPLSKEDCEEEIVQVIDALLHVQQINTQHQLRIREKLLKQILGQAKYETYSNFSNGEVNLGSCLHVLSGLLMRERLSILTLSEQYLWSERVITQDELDVLELLYWRFGFSPKDVAQRMIKQSSLLII